MPIKKDNAHKGGKSKITRAMERRGREGTLEGTAGSRRDFQDGRQYRVMGRQYAYSDGSQIDIGFWTAEGGNGSSKVLHTTVPLNALYTQDNGKSWNIGTDHLDAPETRSYTQETDEVAHALGLDFIKHSGINLSS